MSKPAVLALLLVACACGSTPEHVASPPPSGGYEAHEWGLLRALPGDVLSLGAIGPDVPRVPMAVEKPILYFHVEAPMTLASIDVDAHGGAIVEVWPSPSRTGDASQLRWTNVEIGGERCELSSLPTSCASLPAGDMCETAQLDRARAVGSACVRTESTTDTLLFYRARTQAFTPPLTFERTSEAYDDVRVTNTSDAAIPGWIVRLRDVNGTISTLAVRAPAPHESLVVGHDYASAVTETPVAEESLPPIGGGPDAGRRAIRATMTELGLTDAEVDAFLRAWDPALFGLGATEHASEGVERMPAPLESFLYFLPEADCERVSTVTFDPPPRSFRRAFAVWSPLLSIGVSH